MINENDFEDECYGANEDRGKHDKRHAKAGMANNGAKESFGQSLFKPSILNSNGSL